MSPPADPWPVAPRLLGAAIGAATGPVAAFGQGWAGTGDGRWHIWLLATACGALLGAVSYPLFWVRASARMAEPGLRIEDGASAAPPDIFGVGFAALFAFAVGLVAGAFVAFPMGSLMGALGGALAGAVVAFAARRLYRVRFGLVLASLSGASLALFAAWAWLA